MIVPEEDIIGIVTKVITSNDVNKNGYLKFLKSFYSNSREADYATVIEDERMDIEGERGPQLKCSTVLFQLDTRSKGKIICNCSSHFPVQKEDVVSGRVKMVTVPAEYNSHSGELTHEPGLYFQFTYAPIGIVGRTSDAFYDNIVRYSYGKIKGKTATDLFQVLISTYGTNTNTSTVADAVQVAFESLSKLSESMRSSPAHKLTDLFYDVEGTTCRTLLNNWYWYYLRRRVELLGVERTTITKMIKIGYSMTELYTLIRVDAFILLPLPIEEAIGIKTRLGQTCTDFDIEVAKIARSIYNKVLNDKWTCVPEVFVSGYIDRLSDARLNLTTQMVIDVLKSKYNMVHELDSLYFNQQYRDELLVATRLIRSKDNVVSAETENIIKTNSHVEKLTEEQVDTIREVLKHPISVICGGPGTGKTTIIEQVCENFDIQGISYAIVAFTGKAVARIKEGIKSNVKPMTMHALCYGGWVDPNDENNDKFDRLIIDEVSMVSIPLMAMVYRAFSHDFGIVMVGDINQLEPMDWGFLYKEVLLSKLFNVSTLTRNMRVKVQSSKEGDQNVTMSDGIIANLDNIANIIEGDRQTYENINLFDRTLDLNTYYRRNILGASHLVGLSSYADSSSHSSSSAMIPLTHVESINNIVLVPAGTSCTSVMDQTNSVAIHNRMSFDYITTDNFKMINGGYDEVRIRIQELIDSGDNPKDLVILSPYNAHIANLNFIAQDICIIDRSDPLESDGRLFFKQDVVVMTTNDYIVNIMNGTSGVITMFDINDNEHRAKQIELADRVRPGRRSAKRKVVLTGYTEIDFVTNETARFFVNKVDYEIYKWCLRVLPYLTISSAGRPNYQPNSQDEWEAILTCINRSYQYFVKYSDSVSKFTTLPIFNRVDIQMIFEPLNRVSRHYGYMGDIAHGYAMTVHKAQGSQWRHVLAYLDHESKSSSFLNNLLLNTMLSRAQESVTCIGNPNRFHSSALQTPAPRYDRLATRILRLISIK